MRNSTELSENLQIPTNSYTLEELVHRFLENCRRASPRTGRRLSERTLEYYQSCLEGLLFFAAQEDWPSAVVEITRRHLQDFQYYLETEPNRWHGDGRRMTYKKASPGTVHHYLKVASIFFRWCEDEEYVRESPVRRYRIPVPKYKEVEPYTDEEVTAMLDRCQLDVDRGNRYLGVRNKAMISVFIDTGLRLTELSDMKLSELDPHLQQVRILGKGAKMRVVPLNGEARKALRLYLNQYRPENGSDAVWLTEDGVPMVSNSIQTMLARLKRRAGVKSPGGPHRFRHYFATRYLENGGDINSLRLLLGHSTLYMVLKYTLYVDVRNALNSHAEFSPLDSLSSRFRGNDRHRSENWGWQK